MARRRKTQANWRRRNPDYAIAWRLDRRKAQAQSPEPLRLPPPLPRLPWDLAKDEFGAQGADPHNAFVSTKAGFLRAGTISS